MDPQPLLNPEVLTLKQMAHRINCSEKQVRNLVKEGRVPEPVYIGSSPRWFAADADAYLHLLARGFFPGPPKK